MNRGLAIARGTWIGRLEAGDTLAPHAVGLIADALDAHHDAQFIYTDELIADETGEPIDYVLKPAYDPVLLAGFNYIDRLALYRKDRLLALGGFQIQAPDAPGDRLLLAYLDGLEDREILHLPFPACVHRGMTAKAPPDIDRQRLDPARKKPWPKISIVVPSIDAFELIQALLLDLEEKTDYPDFEIIIVDNGSTDARVRDLYARHRAKYPSSIIVVEAEPFNFSRSVNKGVRLATGEHVLLLNNDVRVVDPLWLTEMVACLDYEDAGIVGARLLYPQDRTLQHAGVIIGLCGPAGHWFRDEPATEPGPWSRLLFRQSLSAVTGACMLISRACLERTGPFDEDCFAVAYNDVDFCLRAGQAGFRVIWTPFATLLHEESATRGDDESLLNLRRLRRARREMANLRARYATSAYDDRAFSPWYSRQKLHPTLVGLDHLPPAR